MRVAEVFYSMQGEGVTAGTPAVFIRLAGCNLRCRFCDTKYAWSGGREVTVDELVGEVLKYEEEIRRRAHIVITGGEPLLQQEALRELVFKLIRYFNTLLPIEVETNGTVTPSPFFFDYAVQFNVSPKLSNSGVPAEERINRQALAKLASGPYTTFKFAVASEDDVRELLSDYQFLIAMVEPERWRIMLMPLAATREEYLRVAPEVAKLAIKYGFRFSPRLQVELGLR